MKRQFIAQLQPREEVDEIYRIVDKQLRPNRQGNLYILIQLADRTGVIAGMRWNADQRLYESLTKGGFARVIGVTQLYNGGMQLIINDLEPAKGEHVNPDDFNAIDSQKTEAHWERLRTLLAPIDEPSLRKIADAFLADATLKEKLAAAPAGVKTHHAFPGGLLQHMVDLMNLVQSVAPAYPYVDRQLLMVGALLHDIGKIDELAFEGELSYTDPGQLVGHLVQGTHILQRLIDRVEADGHPVPQQLLWRLQHMIVSHHGSLEHGSPRVPMTLEAVLLHHLDDLDAKMNATSEWIKADLNSDSRWTNYNPTLGRKMFKPSLHSEQPKS
jgi:3'-5' exoribonuclease